MDGTLIEPWANQKGFQRKDGDGQPGGEFLGEKRTNKTHESRTDADARLYRKGPGQEAKLTYLGHAIRAMKTCQLNGLQEYRLDIAIVSAALVDT